jgi:DHA1 family multidrug resistance protein-like MFS transporter
VFAKESPKFLLSTVEVGYVFTMYGVVGALAPLVLGELSERVGKRIIIIVGMVFEALAFVLLPWVSGIVLLSVTAMLLSFGNSAVSPIMMAFLTDKISASKHGLALGLYGAGEDLGIWVGPLMIGYLYQTYSAEVSFHVAAAIMLVTISFSFFILKKAE